MKKEIQKEIISWYELEQYSAMLAERINFSNSSKYNAIVAITRGGLFVAGLLSHLLDIKNIETIGVQYYTGIAKTKDEPEMIKALNKGSIVNKNVLVVDDLVDSGKTMKFVCDYINSITTCNLHTAVLFKKPTSKFDPDYYIRITDKWLVFPYEK